MSDFDDWFKGNSAAKAIDEVCNYAKDEMQSAWSDGYEEGESDAGQSLSGDAEKEKAREYSLGRYHLSQEILEDLGRLREILTGGETYHPEKARHRLHTLMLFLNSKSNADPDAKESPPKFAAGTRVVYKPELENETGTVMRPSYDLKLCFVLYDGDIHPKATKYEDLVAENQEAAA